MILSDLWDLAIGSTKILTQEPKSSKAADDVLTKLGVNDPVLDIAKELEYAALNDQYFVDRNFILMWTSILALSTEHWGYQPDMFTVLLQWADFQDGLHSGKK